MARQLPLRDEARIRGLCVRSMACNYAGHEYGQADQWTGHAETLWTTIYVSGSLYWEFSSKRPIANWRPRRQRWTLNGGAMSTSA